MTLAKTTMKWFIAAVFMLRSTAQAQPLTLQNALDRARAHNRDLKAARAHLEQAQVAVEQAWNLLLPTLAAQGKYTHNYKQVTLDLSQSTQPLIGLAEAIKMAFPGSEASLNAFEDQVRKAAPGNFVIQKSEQLDFSLGAQLPLVAPSSWVGVAAARKSSAAAEANFAATETAILYGTAQSFFAAAGSDELLTARRHAVEVARRTVQNARARLEAGVVNRVEVTRAELALVRAEQAAREAADARAQAHRGLGTLIDLDENFDVAPSTTIEAPVDATVDEWSKDALRLRPEVLALERSVDAAQLQTATARWRWAPVVSAFGNVRAFNYAGFAGDNYAWAVGLQADWLLYDGGARESAAHLSEAVKRENMFRLSLLHQTISDELKNSREAASTKRQALATAERAVALSRETLELVRVQHDAGTATQLDLLQAQDSLVAAEVGLAQARFDLALSDLALRRTAGRFP